MILVTGSIAFDQILSMPGAFSDYILPDKIHEINVSFVSETHKRRYGGTGGNQAYSLALLDIPVTLVGSAGNDFGQYGSFLKKHGIDTQFIKISTSEPTASGFAITDTHDNQIWGFSKGAMKKAASLALMPIIKKLQKKHTDIFVMIAPNEPKAIANYIDECVRAGISYAFDPAFYIPLLSPSVLKKGMQYADIVFGNDYEMELLSTRLSTKKLQEVTKKDRQIVVTTLGEKGSIIELCGTKTAYKRISILPAVVKKAVDPTGAGDAYRSGFMAGYFFKKDVTTCARMGSVAAAYAVEKYGTMEHSYSVREFNKRFEYNYS